MYLESCALPSCHTGYMSGYIRIHVSWTLHHDLSGYTEIQNHDTCGIHAGYMRDTYLGGLEECIDAIMESSAPIRPLRT